MSSASIRAGLPTCGVALSLCRTLPATSCQSESGRSLRTRAGIGAPVQQAGKIGQIIPLHSGDQSMIEPVPLQPRVQPPDGQAAAEEQGHQNGAEAPKFHDNT